MSAIDEIKQKADIAEIIGQYTKLTRSGKTLKGLCPFHSEKHGSFFVYPDQQSWHCFGACGTGGDVFSFIMKKEGCDFTEAKNALAERLGIILAPETSDIKESRERNDKLYRVNDAACEFYHRLLLSSPEAEKTRQYLIKRGLNAASLENFRLGYAPQEREALIQELAGRGFTAADMLAAGVVTQHDNKIHDLFHCRLLFPIADSKGKTTGFGGRALDDSLPKYLNTPQTNVFDKKATLYGFNRAKETAAKLNSIVIVEGYMDAVIAHQYGFQNVVASMGTAISETHALTLKKATKNVVLALDADSAGEEAMIRSLRLENVVGTEIRMAVLPAGEDPDEVIIANPSSWEGLIRESVPVLDFVFNRVIAPLDLKSARGKSEAAEKLLPAIGEIKDAIRRAHYLGKLAEVTGIQPRELEYRLTDKKPLLPGRKTPAAAREKTTRNATEGYFLSLILKCPECKAEFLDLPPDFFEGSENREIFRAACRFDLPEQIEKVLDSGVWETCKDLLAASIITDNTEVRLADLALRLKQEYYKRLAQRKGDIIEPETAEKIRQIFVDKEKLGIKRRRE